MKREDLERAVRDIRWAHRINLGQGIVTPGLWNTPAILSRLGMPQDLTGQSVLDVGAWDGFYSFEAERRGAKQVVATDSFTWQRQSWGSKDGFDLARQVLASKVEAQEVDVLDLSPEKAGVFDLVLFLGVLYHMRHPMLALERVASVSGQLCIVETVIDLLYVGRPALAFYPGTELNQDESNWFGPTPSAVEAMLRAVGFRRVEMVWPSPARLALWRALSLARSKAIKRAVFHAWK